VKYLLDTSCCILFIKGIERRLVERVISTRASDLAISAVTLAELEAGVALSRNVPRNRRDLSQFRREVRALSFDASAAAHFGAIRAALEKKGAPIGPLDTLIAAHCRSLALTLVTDNVREFARVPGLSVENWLRD
jgi:tRNA(fMet)-specific endonuclease VapC